MAYKLEWSNEALEDIKIIAEYIEKDSPVYAKSVVLKFFEKAEMLQDFPLMGRVVPELDDETIREIFVYSYRLIYKIYKERILLITVIHGKMLLDQRSVKRHNNDI